MCHEAFHAFHGEPGKGNDVVKGAEGRGRQLELKTVRPVRTFGQGSTAAGCVSQKQTDRNKELL